MPGGGAQAADDTASAEEDPEGFASRELQQAADLLPDPNAGYAKAVRIIFTNIFDFFRADGEHCWPPGDHGLLRPRQPARDLDSRALDNSYQPCSQQACMHGR